MNKILSFLLIAFVCLCGSMQEVDALGGGDFGILGLSTIPSSGPGSGDVAGPASSTDNAIVRFDLTTGKILQNSVVTIADSTGNMANIGTASAVEFIESGGSGASTTVVPYIQLTDSTDQEPGVTTPVQVTMDTVDEQQGFSYSGPSGTITIPESGVYGMFAAGQVGKDSGSSVVNVNVWLRKNDVDIDNSNVRNSIKQSDDTKVVLTQNAIRFSINDTLKIYFSVSDATKGAGLKVFNPAGEPRIPSIIFTMFKIGN